MRVGLLDELKGLALINMVVYHVMYDLYGIYDFDMPWFRGSAANLWQEYICWSFIVIAGIVSRYSKHPFRRSFITLGCALVVTAVTYFVMPDQVVIFGILHCIGASMLIVALLRGVLEKVPNAFGIVASAVLILLTWNAMADPPFYSSDYFPLLPYIFVFLLGFYLSDWVESWSESLKKVHIRPLAFLGRHTLIIYMAHQPVIMAVLLLIF